MRPTVEDVDGVTVVMLRENHLDWNNVQEFRRDIRPVLEANNRVVFDLRHLQFVDSMGIGALLTCLRRLNGSGGDLKLCEISKPVRVLFELVRLHRIVEILNTKEEAVRAFECAGVQAQA